MRGDGPAPWRCFQDMGVFYQTDSLGNNLPSNRSMSGPFPEHSVNSRTTNLVRTCRSWC
jgi:hypothetical protein